MTTSSPSRCTGAVRSSWSSRAAIRRADSRRIGRDQHGLGRGEDVQLARQRVLQQQCLQCQHVLGSGELGEYRAGSHGPHGADLVNCRVLYLQGVPLLSQS